MSEVLAGFTDTVHSAREKLPMLPYVERLESTDSLAAELTFLHSFLGYTHIWSDLSSSSPPNKSLIIEVVAATEGLERDVRDAFRIVDEDPDATLATELLNLGRRALGRRVGDLYEYRRSKLGQVLTSLEQKIELLKPKITAAYQDGSLSPQSFFHPQSPSPEARVGALRCWERFCDIVRWNLGYLSCEQKPVLGDALREQMKSLKLTLDSLSWIFITRQWPSPWENNMMALFGPMVVQAAHFCCLCWYNPPIDPTMVQDLAILISDLRCKMMDPDGPEFMDIGIGFLEGYAGQDLGRSIYSFICHILHFQYRSEAPEKELFSLLTCLPKISRLKSSDLLNLTSDIKDVLIQARYTGQNSKDGDKYAYFVLFARMWSLKAEIMVKCPGILPLLTWNDLVEALRDGCRYLEKSIQENEKPAEYHQILELIEGVSKQVRSLYQRSPGTEDYLVHFKVSNLLLNFLVHIVLLKSKALLVKLQEKDARLMLPLQHKVKTLYDELVFLLEFVVNATEKYSAEEERVFLTDVHLVAQEVISFCNTSLPENLTEEGAKNLDVWPIDISEKVQLLMPMLKGHFSQFSGFDFPKTPGMCFIQHLLENLRDLIKCKHESVAHASHHIEAICEDMEFIVSEFQDVFDEDAEKQKCGDVVTKLVHIAYQVEHVIALMFSENKSTWQHSFWLYCWSDEIRHIRKQLTDFDESNNCNDEIHSYPQRLMPVVSKFTESKIEEVMIGHNDQRKQIIARLTRGTKERDVVLISGMPGIGKTTLADHLKACLLYFGALPKGKDIPVWRLQCLWIAEGFIYKLESKSLEDRAKDYLMDLVGRSLIIVAKRRSDGRSLKACRVHDLVRDLCLLKAKDDRFLQLISDNDEPYHSFNALKFGAMYEHFKSSSSRSYEQYRLQFRVDQEQFAVSRPSGRRVRSLIFSAATDKTSRCSYDVSFIPNNFKLLKVLDLESINMGGSFGIGIELLLCLTYLAVCGDMESIPPSLSKLRNLETLIVKGFKRMVLLPDTIWKMKKLRHIHVSNHAVFALPKDDIGRSFQLDSLVTLSLPYFPLEEETNEIIVRLPNLRKLKCTISGPTEFSMNSSRIPSLESLCFLESLKISHFGRVSEIGELKLPLSLKRLTLSNFGLSPDQISATGRLPELQVLKVISCDFEGSSWEMTEGEFQKLEYLKLDTLDIVHWDASSDHLPELKQLIMRNCKHLEEIPSDFMYISTLEKIEVQQCGNLVEESVRKIEEQEIEGLKIFISNSYSA
ncbi:OLC1v1038825C1 [Oldenlandia corymbosa var. corymbosa]|uniref:OLC1v1038825C1 n=1 Tax=Oldenlandia corymbosa var. corymbosa TaxID=529605 RepID=A0AAV1D0W2_OLDCO|nr:OLC1v1038825C1 [Oldenlandia corymbosa var. corymbosa]